jgi:hypothetical protein
VADDPDNLVLARLREIRDMVGRVLEDTTAIKMSLIMTEAHLARINRSIEANADDE